MRTRHLFEVQIDRDDELVPGHPYCLLNVAVAYDLDGEELCIDEVNCLGHSIRVEVVGSVEEQLLEEAIDKARKERLFTIHRGIPKALEVF